MSTARDNASLWSKLTAEQRDELLIALVDQRCGLDGGLALVQTWKVETSKSAVHRFYHAERSNWTIERAKRFAIETQGLLPEEMDAAQRKVVAQKAFELASSSEISAKELLKLRDQEIKLITAQQTEVKIKQAERSLDQAQQKLEQAERKVKALEDQAEATRQANDRAKNLIKDAPMNDELRSRILKEVDEAMGIKF
ncbi:MAG: hypothetical protein K9N47_21065 [Prosthecobacter sp.]|uniref:hypothetical protein n=1 Tax=Prosthecobacter sp. TaxID=1965333 RepID=UPI0026174B42|nr:hypothetical protein [Prosthecobacter sp.]MCF7788627.1 hypothetical protein [Prosthecobacter sp.]